MQTADVHRLEMPNDTWLSASDFGRVTVPYKLSFFYYCSSSVFQPFCWTESPWSG